MERIKRKVDGVLRKVFWLKKSNINLISKEAKQWENESKLMNHIVEQWFINKK